MNCIIIDDDTITCSILEEFIQRTKGINHKHTFRNPIEALNSIENFSSIDFIFLDMEMPEMSGLDFLKSLLVVPPIIFISSNKNYALDAFEFNAIDFLLKPIEYPRFLKGIQKIKESIKDQSSKLNEASNNTFFFKKKNTYFKVSENDIVWLEAHDNYTKVITRDNSFLINNTLKSFEESLPSTSFVRAHRSYIINTSYLARIEENKLFLELNGKISAIPLSKMYKDYIFNSTNSFK